MDLKIKITKKKIIIGIILSIFVVVGFVGWNGYQDFMSPPTTRLEAGSFYPEMAPDDHHIYIQLPIDHDNPGLGTFTDFYLLSPNFKPGGDVVFKLYDNQQEAVGMIGGAEDFQYFDEQIGKDMSYVLIGNRGVSPTLFPEVFNADGSPNYKLALNLYGSRQQIEDIEAVRKDMVKRGLLKEDGKIMLAGGSGGGVLIQQFLDKYGEHVSRAFIESTGAPDIAAENNQSFARNFYDTNPEAAELYYQLYEKGKTSPSLAWMLFKIGINGDTQLQKDILKGEIDDFDLKGKILYVKNWWDLSQNFPLINIIFRSPQELEIKVRVWELVGSDILKYDPKSAQEINLMNEALKVFMSDILDAYQRGEIDVPKIVLDRSKYQGEVLVWANSGDQDFDPKILEKVSAEYPHSRLVVFEEKAHHVQGKSDFQMEFLKTFFEKGLFSTEIEKYFEKVDN